MTCATVGLSATSPVAAARKDELAGRIGMRRSRSEPLLICSLKVSQSTPPPRLRTSQSIGTFRFGITGSILPSSIRSLLFETEEVAGEAIDWEVESQVTTDAFVEENASNMGANWVQMICEVRSRWRDHRAKDEGDGEKDVKWDDCQCGVSYESEEEAEKEKPDWDREAFGRLLNRSSWTETKLFSQLAFLCNRAYVIPDIKAEELSYYGLRLVTSSLEKKQMAAIKVKLEEDSNCGPTDLACPEREPEVPVRSARSSSMAYELAASAASYIHRRAKGLLSPRPETAVLNEDDQIEDAAHHCKGRTYKSKVATYVAATSVTSVVAGAEKAKMEAARDLQSLHSSPCEWFLCEEPSTCTRCFVIQGSDSLASWQANLFFEPTEFEETAALVHRGIYEAAKGIYEQFMPEIKAHIGAHGDRARFRFTGHSLGGSLSLLISLMLLARNAVPRSALHPVVTFGSPAVFCGGQHALRALDLDETYICSVMMHRDIVPRAFSCNYPGHVAHFLKRISSSFRSHPCLNNDKLLYSPLGIQYIIQPDERHSPPHPLLPPGAAMYTLGANDRGALRAFLNTPHPLEMLSHPTAYGSEGTILRDHDSSNYLLAVNALLRQQTRAYVRRSRRQRVKHWWTLVTSPPAAQGSLPVHTWHEHLHVEPVTTEA